MKESNIGLDPGNQIASPVCDVSAAPVGHAAPPRRYTAAGAWPEERPWARLARELHDGVAQDLWYLQDRLTWLAGRNGDSHCEVEAELDKLKQVAKGAYMELRAVLGLLKSYQPPYLDLSAELASVARKFCSTLSMNVTMVSVPEGLEVVVPGELAHQACRVVQEALWNVWQHSNTCQAQVTLHRLAAGVAVTVADSGRGFDPDRVKDGTHGLQSMRQRAELIGGRLSVTARAGQGTRVSLYIPLAGDTGHGQYPTENTGESAGSGRSYPGTPGDRETP